MHSFSKLSFIGFITTLVVLSGCGKSVEIGSPDLSVSDSTSFSSVDTSCSSNTRTHWKFSQPDPTYNRSADVLFVVDTSRSLEDERASVADKIPDFLSQLPPDLDLSIGVMLAHGGASPYSGQLYSSVGTPLVLNSKTQTISQIQSNLTQTLLHSSIADADEANGEALFYSASKSLEEGQVAKLQKQGFYRKDASLGIIFMTDENELCYPPQNYGFTQHPDYVASPGNTEAVAFKKYCQTPEITPLSLYSKLKALKGNSPLTLAGITHIDPTKVPRGKGIEDSIGHGILEFLQLSANAIGIDIGSPSYSSGLSKIGATLTSQLNLSTDFSLSGNRPLDAPSIQVKVDSQAVPFTYVPTLRSVAIAINYAGQSRSIIEVSACVR